MDTPVHINGNEKKKKTEYRNSYIAYLNIQNVIPMSCLLVFGVWLWTELHISTNLNIFRINALLCVAIILSTTICLWLISLTASKELSILLLKLYNDGAIGISSSNLGLRVRKLD